MEWCTRVDNLIDSYSTMSPIRNHIVCKLYSPDWELLGTYNSIKAAAIDAHNKYDCSISGMIKYYTSNGYRLVKESVETNLDEKSREDMR